MSTTNFHTPVEGVASIKKSREAGEFHLVYVNGSKMVGFKIVEAVNSPSSVYLTLVTDTGGVRVQMRFDWGTYVEIEEVV